MYLKNYYNWKGYTVSHAMSTGAYGQSDIGLKDISGNTKYFLYQANGGNSGQFAYLASNWCFNSGLGALVGTGDTAPTADDYALANNATSSISNFSVSVSTSGTGSNVTTTITITGTNSSGSAITLKEVGIYKPIYDSNLTAANILMIRELISKTLTAGESFTLTFTYTEGEPASASTRSASNESKGGETKEEVKEDVKEETKTASEPISEPLEKKVDESPKEEENPEIEDEKEPVEETKTEEPIEDEPEEEESDER